MWRKKKDWKRNQETSCEGCDWWLKWSASDCFILSCIATNLFVYALNVDPADFNLDYPEVYLKDNPNETNRRLIPEKSGLIKKTQHFGKLVT